MKKKLLIISMICVLSISVLTGCSSQKPVEDNKDSVISQIKNNDNQIQEMVIGAIIGEESKKEDDDVEAFVDAYLYNSESIDTENNVANMMMESYSNHVEVKILEKTQATMKLEIKTPNMVILLNNAIEELKNTDDFNKIMIEEKVKEHIDKDAFEYSVFEVVVEYVEEDGKIIIKENIDYLNAIYGGMLIESQNRYNEYKESVSKEAMTSD